MVSISVPRNLYREKQWTNFSVQARAKATNGVPHRIYSIWTSVEGHRSTSLFSCGSIHGYYVRPEKWKKIGQLFSASKVLLGFEQPSQPSQHLFASSLRLCNAPCTSCLPLPRFPTNHLRMFPLTQLSEQSGDGLLRILCVGAHVAQYHFDTDSLVGVVPAVVVRGHANEGIRDFRFAEKWCFGVRGHVDYGARERRGTVEVGFDAGGELRPFCIRRLATAFQALESKKGIPQVAWLIGIPIQTTVPLSCSLTPFPSRTPAFPTAFVTIAERALSNGSAMLTCPTTPPSKKVRGRIYLQT